MAMIRLMEESQATGRVKEIFTEIRETLQIPFVPQLFRALGPHPAQLEAVWIQVKGLFAGGVLDVKTKCLAALAVAAIQHNPYFIQIYSVVLKRLGITEEEISEMLQVAALAASLDALAAGFGLEPEL